MGRLDGRVAIVTGGGGGIGREHAVLFGREGAAVVVDDLGSRTGADAAAVVDEIRAAGGTATATTASATWDGAPEIVQVALDEFGGVDILVNNATAGRNDDLWHYSEAEWDLTMAVNLKGYYALDARGDPTHGAPRGRRRREHQLGIGVRTPLARRVRDGEGRPDRTDAHRGDGGRALRHPLQRDPAAGDDAARSRSTTHTPRRGDR